MGRNFKYIQLKVKVKSYYYFFFELRYGNLNATWMRRMYVQTPPTTESNVGGIYKAFLCIISQITKQEIMKKVRFSFKTPKIHVIKLTNLIEHILNHYSYTKKDFPTYNNIQVTMFCRAALSSFVFTL